MEDADATLAQLRPRPEVLWVKGRALALLGDVAEALAMFEQACALDHRQAELWIDRGACLIRLGRSEEADEALAAAVRLDPYSGRAILQKALLAQSRGRHDEAARLAGQAVEAFEMELEHARRHPERVRDPHLADELDEARRLRGR